MGLRICWPEGWVTLETDTGNCLRCGHPWDMKETVFGYVIKSSSIYTGSF